MTHATDWKLGRYSGITRSTRGFTLLEVLVVVAIIGIMTGVAIGVTPGIIRLAKSEGTTTQVKTFLTRVREVAVTKRRNVEVRFLPPNQLAAEERPIPGVAVAADRFQETITFEGGLEYLTFAGVPDTPDLFGMAGSINVGLAEPVMFTSEGSFTDINGDFVNATLAFGAQGQPRTANAITILGSTAVVRHWRWNGTAWAH